MINCIVILYEYVGKKDHDMNVLYEYIENLKKDGSLEYAAIMKYSFENIKLFDAFTSGMEAVGFADDYAYTWEDTKSPKYKEQHKNYSRFRTLLSDYLNETDNSAVFDGIQFIDLGLPSGKLWAAENATLDGKTHFTFDEAVEAFGEKMPKSKDFQELYNNCDWKWDKKRKGYTVTGCNGNSIFLPASGYRYGSDLGNVGNVGSAGHYWSRTDNGSTYARLLEFWSGCVYPQNNGGRYDGFAVRLVRKSSRA